MNAAKAKNGSKGRKQIKPAPGVVGKLAGSVKGIQEQALKALESPSLKAAKDGRTLAVKMLRELHGLYGKKLDGEFMAVPVLPAEEDDGQDGPTICRTGKQSTLISDAIAAAFEAAPEVRAGFMQILTDYIGTGALIGQRNLDAYDKWEKAGLFDAAPSAGSVQELEQRALAAAGRTVSDVMQKCAADIREINREAAIEAIEGNAERWAERVKQAQAALRGVKVEDFNWGALLTGTKAALIKAGLVSAQFIPAKGKHKEYRLPLNHRDGYMAACYGPTRSGRIPPAWDASIGHGDEKGTYIVKVSYDWVDDLNIRELTERAFEEMNRPDVNMALLRRIVAEIPPLPLSVAVADQIAKAKLYPKAGK